MVCGLGARIKGFDRQLSQAEDTGAERQHGLARPTDIHRPSGFAPPYDPCRRPMHIVLGGSYGVGRFLMGEVPLYRQNLARVGTVRRDVRGWD